MESITIDFDKMPEKEKRVLGDTLYAETRIVSKRRSSSRPGQGIVGFAHTMRNQRDEVVALATRQTLMRCLPGADEPLASPTPAHADTPADTHVITATSTRGTDGTTGVQA